MSELTGFCRLNGLPASGSKGGSTERIAAFPDAGRVEKPDMGKQREAEKTSEITGKP